MALRTTVLSTMLNLQGEAASYQYKKAMNIILWVIAL